MTWTDKKRLADMMPPRYATFSARRTMFVWVFVLAIGLSYGHHVGYHAAIDKINAKMAEKLDIKRFDIEKYLRMEE